MNQGSASERILAICEGTVFNVGASVGDVTAPGQRFRFLFTYDPDAAAGHRTSVEAIYPDAGSEYSLELSSANEPYAGQGGRADLRVLNDASNILLDAFQFDTKSPPDADGFPPVAGAELQYIQLNISNQTGAPSIQPNCRAPSTFGTSATGV